MTKSEPKTLPSQVKRRQAATLCSALLLATMVLAWCLPAATARGKDRIPLWLRPFQWKENPDESVDLPPAKKLLTSPKAGAAGLNVFRWTNNDPGSRSSPPAAGQPQGTPPNRTSQDDLPPDNMSPAIATDGPQQPTAVRISAAAVAEVDRSTERQVTHQRTAVNWPPEQRENAPPSKPAGQGVNPFGWSNAAPKARQSIVPPSDFAAVERLNEPLQWSNDPRGKERPEPLTPPDEPSFGSAVYEALSWAETPDKSTTARLDNSSPPPDATDEELVEWEKQKFAWIRPFYWADEDKYEIDFQNDPMLPDPTAADDYTPMIVRPFNWSNEKKPAPSKPLIAPDVSRRTRTVAFLQQGENLPRPLPQPGSQQLPTTGDEQDEQDDASSSLDGEDKGLLAEAETLGEAPEDRTLQFLRADTVLLKPGEFQYDYGFTYSKFDVTLPLLVSTGPSTVAVEHAEFRIREFEVPLEVRYGLARRVQLFLNVPFGWANTELSFPGFDTFENDGGLGDIIFGGTFLLRHGDVCKPDAILTLAAVAPTGNSPFSPAGLSPSSPALGNGTWSIGSNLLFIRNYDPVVVFYGGGTRHHFLSELNGADFRPGGEYSYLFGLGFAVNSQITFSTRFNGAYVSDTHLDGERIRGTTQEPMTLGLAMTVSKCKKLIEPFLDFGLTDDATDARFGVTWTH